MKVFKLALSAVLLAATSTAADAAVILTVELGGFANNGVINANFELDEIRPLYSAGQVKAVTASYSDSIGNYVAYGLRDLDRFAYVPARSPDEVDFLFSAGPERGVIAVNSTSGTVFINSKGLREGIRGSASVTFSDGTTAAVPEPTSWAMMIGGFGVIGGAMRRRRKIATTVAFG